MYSFSVNVFVLAGDCLIFVVVPVSVIPFAL